MQIRGISRRARVHDEIAFLVAGADDEAGAVGANESALIRGSGVVDVRRDDP